ncbi:MAG TPA: helix-turn-helix domain-containing protein [Blastocatellia bacterium]|nr:helix-turn-helix domain-containing protein [Blastocatellia bacterium]
MNVVTRLFGSSLVELDEFHHPAGEVHHDPDQEQAAGYSISWVEKGSFELAIEKRHWRVDSEVVFVTRPELSFRCHHDEEAPTDVCLSLEYDGKFVEDICRAENLNPERFSPVVPLTNRLAWLRLRLKQASTVSSEALTAEVLAGDVLAATFAGATRNTRRLYKEHQLAWYAERVEAARELMDSQYSTSHSLESLASYIGRSPYHFARDFCELTGSPPHRYLRRIRLAQAAIRLRDGASVTETCFASGFNHPGYFTRVFQQTFGVSPSEYRSGERTAVGGIWRDGSRPCARRPD